MKAVFLYFIAAIAVSGILYGYYHFVLRNKKCHQYNRYYLLTAVLLSIIIPFLNIPVYFTPPATDPSALLQTLTVISSDAAETETVSPVTTSLNSWFSWKNAGIIFYIAVAGIILARLLASVSDVCRLRRRYDSERMGDIHFVNTEEPGTPFSFFNWLFWNKKITLDSEDGRQVLRHELYHIRQKHSWDIILLEITRMVFWINPFLHLISKEITVIHEFLADRFAAAKDKEWNYAELLVVRLLGSTPQRLVNPFFHNQLKRRIAMITSSTKTNYQYLRKLLVLPLAVVVTALFAFKYKPKNETITSANPVIVVIDAGHGAGSGSVATDGTRESDLVLELAKKVKSLNKNENIQILLTRESSQDLDLRKRTEFARAQKADLFISLHLNNAGAADKNGFLVYISKEGSRHTAENKIFGTILLNHFMNLGATDSQLQQQKESIWVLEQSGCPSVLVECGYLSNSNDLLFIKDPANQAKIATSILKGIEQFTIQKESGSKGQK